MPPARNGAAGLAGWLLGWLAGWPSVHSKEQRRKVEVALAPAQRARGIVDWYGVRLQHYHHHQQPATKEAVGCGAQRDTSVALVVSCHNELQS